MPEREQPRELALAWPGWTWLCFVLPLSLLAAEGAVAQSSRAVQDLVESLESREAAEALAAELDYLRANPLDLNRASPDELAELPWISASLADSIVHFRQRQGAFRSVRELQRAGLVDAHTLTLVAPYLYVGRYTRRNRAAVRLRGEKRATQVYSPPWRRLAKIQLAEPRGWSVGAVTESDPGERKAGDFAAAYLSAGAGPSVSLLLGDYTLRLGQGLLFGAPYAAGVGAEVERIAQGTGPSVRGYTFSVETFGMRGAAVRWRRKSFGMLGFLSRRAQDGQVDSTTGELRLSVTGYHRTDLEQARRHAVREGLEGVHLRWDGGGRLGLGTTLASQVLCVRQLRVARRALGFDGHVRWAGARFFGEAAWMPEHGRSWIAGVRLSSPRFEGLFLAHSYGPGLTAAFRSNPYGAGQTGEGQNGAVAGFRFRKSRWGVAVVAEQVVKAQRAGPAQRVLLDVWSRVRPDATLSVRLQDRRGENWGHATDALGRMHPASRATRTTRARLQLDLGRRSLAAQIRAAVVWVGGAAPAQRLYPDGRLLYQQLRWRFSRGSAVTVRFAVFDVRTSAGTVYAYEPNLPGTFSIHSYTGSGWRTALVLRLRLAGISLGLKLARTERLASDSSRSSFSPGWDVGVQVDAIARGAGE